MTSLTKLKIERRKNKGSRADNISLQDDIFNEFIEKLKTAQLPTKLIEALKELWMSDKLISKDDT